MNFYEKNLLYFTGKTNGVLMTFGWVMALAGIWCLVKAFGNLDASHSELVTGVILLIVGGFSINAGKTIEWPVSDADYDREIENYIANLETLALDKLGLDESEVNEIAPIILGGYEFDGVEKVKKGNDGKWRSNIYKVAVLFFSLNELHSYSMRFNTLQEEKNESTDVYFYQDVVSVSTSSLTFKVKIDEQENTINNEAFKLTTKGGTSFSVNILKNQQYAQESVNAMRALLREKKQA